MESLSNYYDPASAFWLKVSVPDFKDYKISYEYSILGHSVADNRLDMLLRFSGDGGHCLLHRHVATTTTLILSGEQHLSEFRLGRKNKSVVRKAGEYALSGADSAPHLERGGPEGATIFMSLHAPDGVLFQYMDLNLENVTSVTIEDYIARWNSGGQVLI
jgi:hypothetical protein